MYNRYVPGHNGVYERQTVPDPPSASRMEEPHCEEKEHAEKTEIAQQQNCPDARTFGGFDLGDLLLLCIVILLIIDADEDDVIPLLIMAAAFLLQH